MVRAPARLVVVLAAPADRRDRCSRKLRSGGGAWLVALGALLVAAASSTQDIVIDAFRIESLTEDEQAAGMASYVAAYRVGMLVSGAGALFLVSGFQWLGFAHRARLERELPGDGGAGGDRHRDHAGRDGSPRSRSPPSIRTHTGGTMRVRRLGTTVVGAFQDFFFREGLVIAIVALVFVVLFKFTDALAGVMTAPFVMDLGFTRKEYATIIKGVGLVALLIGGFAGGYVARAYPLATSLWIGGVLQALANLAFSWQAIVGHDLAWLTFAITLENFTSAIGTVIFVAYLSALCKNPLHTATQYALLTALAAVGRTYLSAGAGFIAAATGWVWFFAICALAAIPGSAGAGVAAARGHFKKLIEQQPK